MEYTVGRLAKLAGVTTRALRHYERIGLLKPEKNASGYRLYNTVQVDRLQQILFYREMGVALEPIKRLLDAPEDAQTEALEAHLRVLSAKRQRMDALIDTVKATIAARKGESAMTDEEKFAAFKQGLVNENKRKYGEEVRARYGDAAADEANAKLLSMTQEQYESTETLSAQVNEAIKAAFAEGDPTGKLAMKACALHKEWLMRHWTQYSPEAHMGLAQMYVDDSRFTAYYDAIAPGCTQFLRDAVFAYCGRTGE